MNFQKKTLSVLVASATLALVACGDSADQDSGANQSTSFTGLVIDGRIAGGKVWVDMNNNYKIDDFEPYAFTDSDGYYSYNPVANSGQGINYCSLPVTSDEYQRYCLIYGSSIDSMVIRVKGGTDLSTGEKLKGIMAMSSTISASRQLSSTPLVLSPITTLLQSANTDTEQTNIRSALGITSDSDLRLDFSTADSDKTKKFLANSVAVQTMMDVLATASNPTKDTAVSIQSGLIKNIASTVATNVLPTALDSTHLNNISQNYITNTTTRTSISSRLNDLNAEIKRIETAVNTNAVAAQLKAAEVVSQLVKKELSTDSTIKANAQTVLNSGIANLSTQLTTNLTPTNVEFDIQTITSSLINNSATIGTDLNNVVTSAVTKATLETITLDNIWTEHFLSLSGINDKGKSTESKGRVIFFFDGKSSDDQGAVSVCYAYNSDNDKDDQSSYIKGQWMKVSKNTVQISTDYGDFQIKAYKKGQIVDDAETTNVDEKNNYLGIGDGNIASNQYGQFFFSSDAIDKDATWYSDFISNTSGTEQEQWGLRKTIGTVPSTADACKTFDYGNYNNILLENLGTLTKN